MEITKVLAVAMIAATLCILLRQTKPEMAMMVSLAAAAVVLLMVLGQLDPVFALMRQLGDLAGVTGDTLTTVLKVLGIAYLGQWGSQMCVDAGESALSGKVELAAKTAMALSVLPVMGSLVGMIVQMMG